MLLFEPKLPAIHWGHLNGGSANQGAFEFNPFWLAAVQNEVRSAGAIGYVLPHGVLSFPQPASRLDPTTLGQLEACIPFYPEPNRAVYELAKTCLRLRPKIPHLIFCETALFLDLPDTASLYALPYELRSRGIRKYGGDGLRHGWALEQIQTVGGCGGRAVSVHLGDQPSVAAFLNGQPIETSMGFSPIAGIPSTSGCGDIDPSIPLALVAAGNTPEAVEQILTQQSGFSALLGASAGFVQMLEDPSQAALDARKLVYYSLLKALGTAIASLGGLDALVFTADQLDRSMPFVLDLCQGLVFMGVDCSDPEPIGAGAWRLSPRVAPIQVMALQYNRWPALASLAKAVL